MAYLLCRRAAQEEVKSGAFFVFSNKRHTRLKVLYFDGSGLWLITRRLEAGLFLAVRR